jgi:hypothetical protein
MLSVPGAVPDALREIEGHSGHKVGPGQPGDQSPRFRLVHMTGRGPCVYAIVDASGELRDAFASRRGAGHAVRMLPLGAGCDGHAVFGTRVHPLAPAPSNSPAVATRAAL